MGASGAPDLLQGSLAQTPLTRETERILGHAGQVDERYPSDETVIQLIPTCRTTVARLTTALERMLESECVPRPTRRIQMDVPMPLEKMSTEDKLRAVEILWGNLSRAPSNVPSPS